MSDQTMKYVKALKRGNQLALASLYDEYGDTLYGIIYRIVKDEGHAQEVLQDTFIKAWNRIEQYDENKSRFFSWIYKITRNTALDKLKSANRARFDALTSNQGGTVVLEENYANKLDVENMLNDLDSPFDEVIHLCYIEGYSQSQISKVLDVPLGTVKSRIRIGLQKLRDKYRLKEPSKKTVYTWLFLTLIMSYFE